MKTKQLLTGLSILLLVLCVSGAWAQQKDPRVNPPANPVPPITPGESSSRTAAEAPTDAAAAPVQSKQPPLTSAEPWSLGGLGGGRSFFVPSLSVGMNADTNSGLARSGSSARMVATVSGRVQIQRVWAARQLQADYATGMEFNSRNSDFNGGAHSFGVSYSMQKNRWGMVFSDRASYATQTRGTIGGIGLGLPGLNQAAGNIDGLYSVTPSILTQRAGRITNTVMGEARYVAGRRSAFTFSGAYGLLHFLESGYVNAKSGNFGAGYNYSLNGKDTIGVSYSGSLLRFDNDQPGVNTHSVNLSYGRSLTGKLSLQVGGGAQFTKFGDAATSGTRSVVSWSVRNALRYRLSWSDLGLSYSRGVTEGSGIFAGAVTQNVQFNFGRQVSRMWRADFGGGYARNERLGGSTTPGGAINSWFARTGLTRPVGRYTSMSVRYYMQRQSGGSMDIGTRHAVGVSFNFRFKPFEID
jgi:hypothetical protein